MAAAPPTPGTTEATDNDHFLLQGGSVGNITHAISRTQTVVNQYDYDAFGSRTTIAGNNSTNFGYTGEQYNEETGLLYLRALSIVLGIIMRAIVLAALT